MPERTAYRWAKEPKVRTAVEGWRRRALDRAVGRMAKRATWAADQIADLGATAESESVKLAALRSVLSDMMKVAEFSVPRTRQLVEVEELLRVRDGAAPVFALDNLLDRPRQGSLWPARGRGHRPLALGLVRRILPMSRRAGTRRVPRSSPSPAHPAAPRGRLAGLGVDVAGRGAAQDASRAPAGSSTASRPAP